ncbi:DUF3108 domain-containing protein [Ichthyobacterium seriolicida]|uniref:DUF3108 domain-containing protein n=1 Tax=Ichthyobacterium seriolicida TaxID=242600 RepID=A0A1J1E6E6_9FLAO|nr:DUF3108 domain-containing protein [Ichthyobacterium seriolicida]BAV94894.1 hypothetical protein JBKA6_0881 [Ichthyobacterium seriolicida]
MNRGILILKLFCLLSSSALGQNPEPFKRGEWLRYQISYTILDLAEVVFEVKDTSDSLDYEIEVKGKTVDMLSWFYDADYKYLSFMDKKKNISNRSVRKIVENGAIMINRDITFDQDKGTATVLDNLAKKDTIIDIISNKTQDIVSMFYHVRLQDLSPMEVKDTLSVPLFIDKKMFNLKLILQAIEDVKTSFGYIPCYKFFAWEETGSLLRNGNTLTIWISKDDNKIPIKSEITIFLGSVKLMLNGFKKLQNPIYFRKE